MKVTNFTKRELKRRRFEVSVGDIIYHKLTLEPMIIASTREVYLGHEDYETRYTLRNKKMEKFECLRSEFYKREPR